MLEQKKLHYYRDNISMRVFGVLPMVPLFGNICISLIVNGIIGKEIGANGKNGNTIAVPMVQM